MKPISKAIKFAFIFGVLPLVTSSGAGAELRQALGTAVFSGLSTSNAETIFSATPHHSIGNKKGDQPC